MLSIFFAGNFCKMTNQNLEQQFLNELDDKLWKAADKLRNNLDAANYKHIVLGLIFLKYVSDAFEERQSELRELFATDKDDNIYYMPRENYKSDAEYAQAIEDELEILDYYQEKNVFWVPKAARWSTLRETAAQPTNSVIWKNDKGEDVKLRSVSWLIDNALDEIEQSNSKLKGILNRVSQYQLDSDKLIGLINNFSDTSFSNPVYNGEKVNLHSKDILGHVYEYFLGQFALAEGKQGGQYYTPKSIVTLIVEMLEPYKGRVYDPAMGSGGFFVSSDRFIAEHAKEKHYDASEQRKHISVYGQESNPTTWKLAAMNMAIRGIDFNFGKKNADSFLDDQHPDLRADFVMANPPFNIKDWWSAKLENDVRWEYGTPPQGNANFGWIQHMLYHLNDNGSMALLLANGSMSSNTNNEGEIRKALILKDRVECMVALPGQLFTNTQIPACIWFLTKNKKGGNGKADRRGKTLFIDARQMGYMKDRVLRDFTKEDIAKIADTFHKWKASQPPEGGVTMKAESAILPKGGTTMDREQESEIFPKEEVTRRADTQLPNNVNPNLVNKKAVFEPSVLKSANPAMYAKLEQRAKDMRANPTEAEAVLWEKLRNKQLGIKFRQQHVIDRFIADFCSIEGRLIIEVDGDIHDDQKIADEKRTHILEYYGYSVIRFRNDEVIDQTDKVLEQIKNHLKCLDTASQWPLHPPKGTEDSEAISDTVDPSTVVFSSPLGERGAIKDTEPNNFATSAYVDIPGFCFSASLQDIEKNDFVLTPGRYVGAVEQEDDGIPFAEKMTELTAKLKRQFEESEKLENEIRKNLAGLGYEI